MVTIFALGIFSIIFLTIISIISNASPTAQASIQNNLYLMGCPFPLQNQLMDLTQPPTVLNNAVVYVALPPNQKVSNVTGTGTFFYCFIQTVNPKVPEVNTYPRDYQATAFANFPSGWFQWVGDSLGVLFQRVVAFGQLLYFFLTPVNFNIAGFTINNLSGQALMLIVGIYAICYLSVGTMVYKALSPFTGG